MASLARLATVGVGQIKGLGGKRASNMKEAGVVSVADFLHHVPRRYIDRSRKEPIARVPIGSEVTIIGSVRSVSHRRPRRNLQIIEAVIEDDSARIKAVWFNQGYLVRMLENANEVALSGVVESFRGSLQMKTPAVDVLSSDTEGLTVGRVVPVHPAIGGVSPGHVRRAMHNALKRSRPIDDSLPTELKAANGLMERDKAFGSIHFPDSLEEVEPARKRLVYDELFRLELALAMQKRHQMDTAIGIEHRPTGELVDRFLGGLPYDLTRAQTRVLGEIEDDLRQRHPMHRLLQGEVGSGKTVVAVATLLRGIEGGWQGAIMAPTEVLAEQHYLGVRSLLADAGLSPALGESHLGMDSLFTENRNGPAVHVALLTGSTATTNYNADIGRTELVDDILSGQVDLVVGTHALIQEGVDFARLGVAVVDEQHRFGVAQRVRLKEKAETAEPDLLIMTATPIPRTLSMTMYGDLEVSIIDEMPPGRTPVKTKLISKVEETTAWKVIESEVAKGRQAFVVCPLVDDSPKVEAASATAEHERLAALMSGLRVGLIHGQMRSVDKEEVMAAFRAGEIDVLVATTVIEVGIDVPNATVMVIEDAHRFGLSQLHQLRGRVGRGEHAGQCLLLADPTTDEGEERLRAMVGTTDGFRLAEEDLRIRGQGTVFGTRQSGVKDLKLANIMSDFDVLVAARRDAFAIVESDPALAGYPELREEVAAMLGDEAAWLFVS
ncbi:MAG TPA: ATP-dependent DNA helicase RecG [Acidimicrobiia bacterium]|nr:ATP-dependent DNA helicase RecG [Acidimicrobiia bacterium]